MNPVALIPPPASRLLPRRGFTLLEALVVIALMAVVGTLVTLEVAGVRPAGERLTRSQQQRALQEALDRWLAAQPSLATAHTAFLGEGGKTHPPDQREFLTNSLGPFLAPGALDEWSASSTANLLRTPLWPPDEGLQLTWPADWRNTSPRVERVSVSASP